jgi:UDPglucose 6-dehydrogenase
MRITMIGSGYVGLVSGSCFADFGHDVTCVDKDSTKIDQLNQGVMPIFEPGLDHLVARNVEAGRLRFTVDAAQAISASDAVFIGVGTPARSSDGHADLSYVYAAAEEIADLIKDFTVIVTKSTVPVGTGDEIEAIIRKRRPSAEFAVVSNPEFLREGAAIRDFQEPDRVVIGGADDPRARQIMQDLYRPLMAQETPILFTSRRTSELTKYAANAFLAMKITFINEIANLCERVDADVQEVSLGIGLDERIGKRFLQAGPGYGGSCFPKDTLALMRTARDAGAPVELIETTVRINDARKQAMAQKIVQAMGGDVQGKTIAVLGLTFKPNTDDMRDAPSLEILPALQAEGARIRAFDPEGMHEAQRHFKNIDYAASTTDAIEGADALVILTEWDAFKAIELGKLKTMLSAPIVVDLRNMFSIAEMNRYGIRHFGVGRPENSRQISNAKELHDVSC